MRTQTVSLLAYLYAIGCGTGWGKNVDTPIVRIENTGNP
jgi:hypothetical protein